MSRSRILGDFYARCDRLKDHIAVFLNDAAGEKLGVVDESLGKYADAFTFHLSEENCKMLAGGKYDFTFNYQFAAPAAVASPKSKRRIELTSMFLTARETHDKPITTTEPPTISVEPDIANAAQHAARVARKFDDRAWSAAAG